MPIVVLPEVFNPTLFGSSKALIRLLPEWVTSDIRVLDMGTGSGACAIAAARLGAWVTAVDSSPHAVRCAQINVLLNRVEHRVDVREGDLFEPVSGDRFDLVLFNPPYFRGEPREPWELAWRSPDALDRFARDLTTALSPDGRALLAVSTETEGLDVAVDEGSLRSRVVWDRRYGGERLMIQEWTPAVESLER